MSNRPGAVTTDKGGRPRTDKGGRPLVDRPKPKPEQEGETK